jgi:hydroxymethylbilane synthase
MKRTLRIGTRDSQLAIWQATLVQQRLRQEGTQTELVYIKSDGDIDLVTPLYAMGVQGVFTKTLDAALLSNRIDIAVHSMKDVPTQPAQGIQQAAVLERGSHKDILVYKNSDVLTQLGYNKSRLSIVDRQWTMDYGQSTLIVATSSVRRKAQWLHRYPWHRIDNLRGNVNTRMQKLENSNWDGAIFAAAGLERIDLRPENSVDLDWMLPAPSQGAIMVVCREEDTESRDICMVLNDKTTALCTQIEKDFLRVLMGGCSTPISAFAQLHNDTVFFRGSILSPDGKEKADIELETPLDEADVLGAKAAQQLLNQGAGSIIAAIRNAGL